MKKNWTFAALAATFSLALTGCGSSDGDSASDTSGGPLKVGLMIPIADNPTPPDVFTKPAEMAVEEINADGGIDGRQLELTQYDAGFTAEGAITAMQKAVSDDVSLVVGLPIAEQVLAVRPAVDQAETPLLFTGGGFAVAYDPDDNAGTSEWSFRVGPPSEFTVNAGVQFAIDELGAKKVGLLLSEAAGKDTSEQAARDGAQAAGGEISAVRTVPPDSTDLTTEILAMSDSDAIFTTEFVPGIVSALTTIDQQDLNVPLVAGQTGMTVYLDDAAPDLISTMYSSAPCNLFDPYSDAAGDWATDFEAKYDFMPDPNSATTYDAFYLFKTAYEEAGGEGDSLLSALENLNYEGVCMEYDVDDQHFMASTEVVVDYSGDTPKTVASYEFEE